MRPSYIDTTKLPTNAITESVRLIAEVQGSVIRVEHPLIEKTLEKALERFLKEPGPFDAVFVEEMAASTSHAATVFRGEALPIVSLLPGTHIEERGLIPLLDVQRQKLFYVNTMPPELIQEGRIAFPKAREESLLAPTAATRRKIWEALPRASAIDMRSFHLSEEQKAIGFLSSLEKIGTSESAAVQLHAVDLMMKRLLLLLKKGAPGTVLGTALATLKEKLQGEASPESVKQILFAKRTLEAAIFQDETAAIASSSSLKAFFLELQRTKKQWLLGNLTAIPLWKPKKSTALFILFRGWSLLKKTK